MGPLVSQDKFRTTIRATSLAHVPQWNLSYRQKTKKINSLNTKFKSSKSKIAISHRSKIWWWLMTTVTILLAPSTSLDKRKITISKHRRKEWSKIQCTRVQILHQWVLINTLWILLLHYKSKMAMEHIISIISPTTLFRWISKRPEINWRELRRNSFKFLIAKTLQQLLQQTRRKLQLRKVPVGGSKHSKDATGAAKCNCCIKK